MNFVRPRSAGDEVPDLMIKIGGTYNTAHADLGRTSKFSWQNESMVRQKQSLRRVLLRSCS